MIAMPIRPRILVIDADSDLRLFYTDALAPPGYSVDLAADAAAGWEALQVRNYHLLITEHDLPGLSGLELVGKLRSARLDLPVVLAVARVPVYDLLRHPSLNVAATLVKPFAIEDLLDTVTTALLAPPSPWLSLQL